MTHAQFLLAKPFEQDLDVLTQALSLFPETTPETVTPSDVAVLISTLTPIINTSTGDARISDALNAESHVFWAALKNALSVVLSNIEADRDAI